MKKGLVFSVFSDDFYEVVNHFLDRLFTMSWPKSVYDVVNPDK
jgi:hypothetical protein